MTFFLEKSTINTSRIPFGLFGSLLIICMIEYHIASNPLDYLTGSQWGYKIAAKVAQRDASKYSIWCFGDSLAKLSFAPKVVQAEIGWSSYNFALGGGQAAGSYLLFRQALESGARPRAVVVDFVPNLLATTPHFNDENLPLLVSASDCFNLAVAFGDPDQFTRLMIAGLIPSIQSRSALRSNVIQAFAPTLFSARMEILRMTRNWRVNRGAEIIASQPMPPYNLDEWERCNFTDFASLPINQHFVEGFLDLADKNEIPVFWLTPPYHPLLQERTKRSGFDARHKAYLNGMLARHPRLVVLDAQHSHYESAAFVDFFHLNRIGAAAFSTDVARAIRQSFCEPNPSTAWITLPRYRPRTEGVTLEDGDQSRRVIWDETEGGKLRGQIR